MWKTKTHLQSAQTRWLSPSCIDFEYAFSYSGFTETLAAFPCKTGRTSLIMRSIWVSIEKITEVCLRIANQTAVTQYGK